MVTREVWLKDGRVLVGEFTVMVDMMGHPAWIEGRERVGLELTHYTSMWPIHHVLKWTTQSLPAAGDKPAPSSREDDTYPGCGWSPRASAIAQQLTTLGFLNRDVALWIVKRAVQHVLEEKL